MCKKRFDDIPFGGKFDINFKIDDINYTISSGYKIDKVIYNGPATIVIWDDGSKTVAKFNDEGADLYSEFTGLLVAVMKRLVQPNQIKQLCNDWLPECYQNQVTLSDVRQRHRIRKDNINED